MRHKYTICRQERSAYQTAEHVFLKLTKQIFLITRKNKNENKNNNKKKKEEKENGNQKIFQGAQNQHTRSQHLGHKLLAQGTTKTTNSTAGRRRKKKKDGQNTKTNVRESNRENTKNTTATQHALAVIINTMNAWKGGGYY